jgi:DNA-binding CsgD family transcriptional regulator
MGTIGNSGVAGLVGGIYDAALDSSCWPTFLQMAASAFCAKTGVMWAHDFQSMEADFDNSGANLAAFVGFDASSLDSYANHYSPLNVWAANEGGQPEGAVVSSSALYPDSLLTDTEFYNDWLRPQDLFYSLGSIVLKREARAVKMSFLRSERAGRYGEAELALFSQIMPHLRSAIALHRKLHQLQVLSSAAMAALDAIAHGVILLKCDGSYLHANRIAQELLIKTGVLQISAAGSVHAAQGSVDAALQILIGRAVKTGTGRGVEPGGVLRIISASRPVVLVDVLPLPARSSPFGEQVAVAIFCRSQETGPVAHGSLTKALVSLYQMTPSEALLTQALVSGQSLREHALARGISVNTVRSQLRAATAKTDAKRQADLVRIVLTGPAALMAGRSSASK